MFPKVRHKSICDEGLSVGNYIPVSLELTFCDLFLYGTFVSDFR